jgi:hypothetical protein
MIQINQNSNAQITIDQTGNALYSDMTLQSGTLTPLNQNSNFRFYFAPVSSLSTIFYASFTLSHVYSSFGNYNMTLKSAKLSSSLIATVNVTGCKLT